MVVQLHGWGEEAEAGVMVELRVEFQHGRPFPAPHQVHEACPVGGDDDSGGGEQFHLLCKAHLLQVAGFESVAFQDGKQLILVQYPAAGGAVPGDVDQPVRGFRPIASLSEQEGVSVLGPSGHVDFFVQLVAAQVGEPEVVDEGGAEQAVRLYDRPGFCLQHLRFAYSQKPQGLFLEGKFAAEHIVIRLHPARPEYPPAQQQLHHEVIVAVLQSWQTEHQDSSADVTARAEVQFFSCQGVYLLRADLLQNPALPAERLLPAGDEFAFPYDEHLVFRDFRGIRGKVPVPA